jgi:hypothetical protein
MDTPMIWLADAGHHIGNNSLMTEAAGNIKTMACVQAIGHTGVEGPTCFVYGCQQLPVALIAHSLEAQTHQPKARGRS